MCGTPAKNKLHWNNTNELQKNIQHPTTEYSIAFGWKTKDSNIFCFSVLPTHALRNYKSYSLPNICPMIIYNGMKSKKRFMILSGSRYWKRSSMRPHLVWKNIITKTSQKLDNKIWNELNKFRIWTRVELLWAYWRILGFH